MITAWVLMIYIVVAPGDPQPRMLDAIKFETIQGCVVGEKEVKAAARRMGREVVTGCIKLYQGETL